MPFTLMEPCQRYVMKLFLAFIFASMIVNVLGSINPKDIKQTFQMENGDIVDCVDIYKQPGLSHPLLQDKKAKMEVLKSLRYSLAVNSKTRSYKSGIQCPVKTVPIRRMKPQENINAMRGMKPQENINGRLQGDQALYYALQLSENGLYRGFRASFAAYRLKGTQPKQASQGLIMIANYLDPIYYDKIVVGWMVSKDYGDEEPRLTMDFRVNRTGGCYNAVCEGFVQTSTLVFPGMIIPNVSVVGEAPQDFNLTLVRGLKTAEWSLYFNDEQVGYWPATLFSYMADRFREVAIGGYASSKKDVPSPPMGSGLEPKEGRGRAAYISGMEVAIDQAFVPANGLFGRKILTDPQCYMVDDVVNLDSQLYLFYGGRGGCTTA